MMLTNAFFKMNLTNAGRNHMLSNMVITVTCMDTSHIFIVSGFKLLFLVGSLEQKFLPKIRTYICIYAKWVRVTPILDEWRHHWCCGQPYWKVQRALGEMM